MNRFTAFMRIEFFDQFVMNLDASLNSSWTWGNRMIVSFFLLNTTTTHFAILFSRTWIENVAFCLLVGNLKSIFLDFCNLCFCTKTYVRVNCGILISSYILPNRIFSMFDTHNGSEWKMKIILRHIFKKNYFSLIVHEMY